MKDSKKSFGFDYSSLEIYVYGWVHIAIHKNYFQ